MFLVQFINIYFKPHFSKPTNHCHKLRREFSSSSPISTDLAVFFFYKQHISCCIKNVFNSFTYLNLFILYVLIINITDFFK